MKTTSILESKEARERDRDFQAWIYESGEGTGAASSGPLAGALCGVKDNIDVAGMPTTAGCPSFAFVPEQDACVVSRLRAAGALVVGKTAMDQFATGLVGTRSRLGPCRNSLAPDYISGGSSSGSAVALARGHVDFSLGTDTAGSGRVPAALNGLVGVKPTIGTLSSRGVVPACRSLDTVSIFARTLAEAGEVLRVCRQFDPLDPFSRPWQPEVLAFPQSPRMGVLSADQVARRCSAEVAALYGKAVASYEIAGTKLVEIDYEPFAEAADLLYSGPWVAERWAAVGKHIASSADDLDPTVAKIISGGQILTAEAAFLGQYRLRELQRKTEAVWEKMDVLCLPTIPELYTIAQVLADPIASNSRLGMFNNFVNLLDLAALTVPAGNFLAGPGFGVNLIGRRFTDDALLELAARLLGEPPCEFPAAEGEILLAVVGAHLRGLPLHHELEKLGARFVRCAHTAAHYRLFALPGTHPPKPGLLRVNDSGCSIALEIYAMTAAAFGAFVGRIPPPLGIGTVELEEGSPVKCFLCEAAALGGALDVSSFGGWRRYLTDKN